MKVLYANTTLPPLHFGGSEVYCMGLAKSMPQLGVETAAVSIESWGDGDHRTQFRRAETYDGVRIHRLYSNEHWEPLSTLWTGSTFYERQFEEILDEEKPDLIHVMAHLRLAKLIQLAKKRGIPVVLTGVDFSPFCGRSSLVKWDNDLCDGKAEIGKCRECLAFSHGLNPADWHGRASQAWDMVSGLGEGTRDRVYRMAARLKPKGMGRVRYFDEWGHRTAQRIIEHIPELFGALHRVFAPSPIMREMWEKNGYPPEKIVDMPYGVEVGAAETGRFKTRSDVFRFAYVGRFNGLKNLRTLLEAFFLINGKAPFILSLYGAEDFWDHGNPEIDHLKKMAENCPNLRFMGRLNRAEMSQAYEEIDCLVAPSLWYENAPISMMEAQRFGTPVICTDLPGMTCLVEHEVNGLVFRNKSARGLALQMYRLATEPDLYKRLRSNSIEIQTTLENAKLVLKHYLDVTGMAAPAAPASLNGSSGPKNKAAVGPQLSSQRALGLAQELGFWSGEMTDDRKYPWHADRMSREGRQSQFPEFLYPILAQAREEFGVTVLDVLELGPGPLSTLGWAAETGLCNVTAVDPLADQYNSLLDEFCPDAPIRPVAGTGENLPEIVSPESFHIVFAANSLDSVESPVATFDNLVAALKPGGYICMAHFTHEGTAENWQQLHQWDLWVENDVVLVANREGKTWQLNQSPELETVSVREIAMSERSVFHIVYQKPSRVAAGKHAEASV